MNKSHGYTTNYKASSTYATWADMVQRCTNPNHRRFKDYGGRDIFVCVDESPQSNRDGDSRMNPELFHQAHELRKDIDRKQNCLDAVREAIIDPEHNHIRMLIEDNLMPAKAFVPAMQAYAEILCIELTRLQKKFEEL